MNPDRVREYFSKDRPQVRCTRCAMDTSAIEIDFDEDGVCSFCTGWDATDSAHPNDAEGQERLTRIVERIKSESSGPYDCVLGVSGGTDSSYLLKWAVEVGLRPLAVHCDNGWNSDVSVSNLETVTNALGVDLVTKVLDWPQFKGLQRAFLHASVPDADKPTDMALRAVMYDAAAKYGVKAILVGVSFRNEGNVPITWSYGDYRYIRSVHRAHGRGRIDRLPVLSASKLLWLGAARGIKQVRPLWYLPYQKEVAKQELESSLGWQYYGGHHFENRYTKFLHAFYLPLKFGFDKRKVEYSALIRSGQLDRSDALARLQEAPYDPEDMLADADFVRRKLDFEKDEWGGILEAPARSVFDYDSYLPMLRRWNWAARTFFSLVYERPPQIFQYLEQLDRVNRA